MTSRGWHTEGALTPDDRGALGIVPLADHVALGQLFPSVPWVAQPVSNACGYPCLRSQSRTSVSGENDEGCGDGRRGRWEAPGMQ